jgi:hypothetical protein
VGLGTEVVLFTGVIWDTVEKRSNIYKTPTMALTISNTKETNVTIAVALKNPLLAIGWSDSFRSPTDIKIIPTICIKTPTTIIVSITPKNITNKPVLKRPKLSLLTGCPWFGT